MPNISTSTLAALPAPRAQAATCLHCGQTVPDGTRAAYCCIGCETVHHALSDGGLLRYYELRGEAAEPVGELHLERRDRLWLEPIACSLAESPSPQAVTLGVQGLRCAACVWLIQELFERRSVGDLVLVSPGRATISLHVRPDFPLRAWIADIERFGYVVGPPRADAAPNNDLLLRLAATAAIAANTMMFSLAIYLGLEHGPLRAFFHTLSFGLTCLAVLIGAPVFITSAWHAIRMRVWHLDVPIAAGILLTFAAACWSFISGQTDAAYYDSLSIFIALMLLGRYLQQRAVHRNQQQLLASTGEGAIVTRRVRDGVVELVPAAQLREGDELLISAGELCPVKCTLTSETAQCSLDWITGESDPALYTRGATIAAGAFNAADHAFLARADEPFAASALRELLASPEQDTEHAKSRRGDRFARIYVPSVLVAASAGLVGWWWRSGSIEAGLAVATAVCVVTCPCAIGIATPLANDLVLGRLRRAGLFVRSATLLDRLLDVRRVVFDKTGTLTTGRLKVASPDALAALSPDARDALYTMTASSSHPKSVAVYRALHDLGARHLRDAAVREEPGLGMHATVDGHSYRLGRPSFVTGDHAAAGLCFGADGALLTNIELSEDLRHDSAKEIARLQARGYDTWILSGDTSDRVEQLAQTLGVPSHQALGDRSPNDKADFIRANAPQDTLMIGDGINDSLAVSQARCSGTPTIDRAFMPGRTDFYFVTAGLAPITLALDLAQRLSRVTRINQSFAVLYNVGAVGLALAGVMRPWLAAVLMPLSSLVVLTWTTALLTRHTRERADGWKR